MSRLFSCALAALVLLLAPTASAQDNADLRRVVLTNGDVLVGTVADESADPVVLTTSAGIEQRIPRDQIEEIGPLLDGRFTRYDPARTRLFVSPTARSLGAGNRRFSAYYVFPSVAFGVNERLDVSVGSTIPLIGVGLDGEALVVLNGNAKVTLVEGEGFAAAVGGNALVPVSSSEGVPGVGGAVYGLATFGGDAGAVTLGAFGVYATDFEDGVFGNGMAILVGLERQVSDQFKVISENYLLVPFEDQGVGIGTLTGVRFFSDRLAADAAVAFGGADGDFTTIPIPYLGLSYTF